MTEKDKKYSLRLVLEEDQHEALRELAFKMRTTKTALIRKAISDLMTNISDEIIKEIEFED